MLENLLVIVSLLRHAVGAVLAHAHAVAEAGGGEDHMVILNIISEVRRRQSEKIPDLAAGEFVVADLDGLDAAAGSPGRDFHLLHVGFLDRLAVEPVDCPHKGIDGNGLGFLLVGGIVLIGALHAPQIGNHVGEDFLRVLRPSAGRGMEHQIAGQFVIVIDDLALCFHGGLQELAPVLVHPLVPLLFPKFLFGGKGLAVNGIAQVAHPGQPVGPGRYRLGFQRLHFKLAVHFAGHNAGDIFLQGERQVFAGGYPFDRDGHAALADLFFHFFHFGLGDPLLVRSCAIRQCDIRDPVQQDHRNCQYIR